MRGVMSSQNVNKPTITELGNYINVKHNNGVVYIPLKNVKQFHIDVEQCRVIYKDNYALIITKAK